MYDLYPSSGQHQNGSIAAPLSISQSNLHDGSPAAIDPYAHYNAQQQRRPQNGLQLNASTNKFNVHAEIPLNEFPAHVEHLKQNSNELFVKVIF
jgi:hypothetical protein